MHATNTRETRRSAISRGLRFHPWHRTLTQAQAQAQVQFHKDAPRRSYLGLEALDGCEQRHRQHFNNQNTCPEGVALEHRIGEAQ